MADVGESVAIVHSKTVTTERCCGAISSPARAKGTNRSRL